MTVITGHTQRRNSNTCQEPGPTDMSDGMRSTNINLALRTSVMGHDPCKKIRFNVVFLVVVANKVSALCGYVQCESLCVVVCVVAVVVVMVLYMGDGHDPFKKKNPWR